MGFLKRFFGKKDVEAIQKPSSINTQVPTPPSPETVEANTLAAILDKHFNLKELQSLCFDLGVEFENLRGNTKRGKVFELINYFETPPREIFPLIATTIKLRPNVDWNNPSSDFDLRQKYFPILLNYCFNKNELMDLCLKLGIKYENLAGSDSQKPFELVAYVYRMGRIEEFIAICASLRPKAPWNSTNQKYEPYSLDQLNTLQQLIYDNFDEDTIRHFCLELFVDFKRLPEWEHGGTARELVLYLARRERLDELVAFCTNQLPEIPWKDVLSKPEELAEDSESVEESVLDHPEKPEGPVTIQNDPASLQEILAKMDEDLFRTLCFDLGIDYENLSPGNKRRELIMLMQQRNQIPALIQAIDFLMNDSG